MTNLWDERNTEIDRPTTCGSIDREIRKSKSDGQNQADQTSFNKV